MSFFRLLFLLIVFIGYKITYSQQIATIFHDDFTDNRNEWLEKNSNQHKTKVTNNTFFLHNKLRNGSLAATKEIEMNHENDFIIEATMRRIKGFENDGYGLTWGRFNSENSFSFTISESGGFEIGKWQNGKWQNMVKSTQSEHINTKNKFNQMAIKKSKNQISFYINQNLVSELPFENFFGFDLGFIIYHNMVVEVENIRVSGTSYFQGYSYNSKNSLRKHNEQDILIRNIEYKDYDGDTVLKSVNNGDIFFDLFNNSKINFKELSVLLTPLNSDQNIEYKPITQVFNLKPGSTKKVSIDIFANKQFQGGSKTFRIDVIEKDGFVANPLEFSISSEAFSQPDVRVEKIIIDDTIDESGKTLRYGNANSMIDAGEVIEAAIFLKNYGGKENNFYAKINLKTRSYDISFKERGQRMQLGNFEPNETKIIKFSFFTNSRFGINDIPFIMNLYYSHRMHKEIDFGLKHGELWNRKYLKYTYSEVINTVKKPTIEIADIDTGYKNAQIKSDLLVVIIGSDQHYKEYQSNFAKNDAQVFYQYAKTVFGVPEKNIFMRLNETISAAEFLSLFSKNGWISQKSNKNEMSLIIYFSGHGYPNMQWKDDLQILQYLNPNFNKETGESKISNEIYKLSEAKNLKSISVIVDACYSGNRATHSMQLSDNAEKFLIDRKSEFPNENISYLSSAPLDKYGIALEQKNHSFLTYFLFKTIKSKNALPNISIQDILQEMKKDSSLNNTEKEAIYDIFFISKNTKRQLF
ncbi:MAG: hypothetical protein HN704_08735 [Bacteroidetes bacterium]|jgi:hypothetical protein|nr:hypothetical protein [Bacteroidota bacterium]MBT6687499.1 hypothetical protein [Bacteroidota bacterium]MBT7142987.1 hypothetical protein [Bacteroidota bacterium]MBT7491677.1 hypothetical protein [Bacteroidota bacterium]